MKNFLTIPFRAAIQELKTDNKLRKTQEYKRSKIKLFPLMAMSCMFLFIMSILYISIFYLFIISILDPKSFFVVPLIIFMTWMFALMYTKIFVKNKKNFYKSVGFRIESK